MCIIIECYSLYVHVYIYILLKLTNYNYDTFYIASTNRVKWLKCILPPSDDGYWVYYSCVQIPFTFIYKIYAGIYTRVRCKIICTGDCVNVVKLINKAEIFIYYFRLKEIIICFVLNRKPTGLTTPRAGVRE